MNLRNSITKVFIFSEAEVRYTHEFLKLAIDHVLTIIWKAVLQGIYHMARRTLYLQEIIVNILDWKSPCSASQFIADSFEI